MKQGATNSEMSGASLTSANVVAFPAQRLPELVRFDRRELSSILGVYGRQVAMGEWRDYALDFGRERAVFSILRRTGEAPIYRIEKDPKRAARQGAYAVLGQDGRVLKRGADLERVLKVLEKPARIVG
ncbi:MAG: DUF2794 domain-containing protein [Proteobacteria bacterium]|nr:DUF2794 domain-containing protein [Pseudomonadota bacterium]